MICFTHCIETDLLCLQHARCACALCYACQQCVQMHSYVHLFLFCNITLYHNDQSRLIRCVNVMKHMLPKLVAVSAVLYASLLASTMPVFS